MPTKDTLPSVHVSLTRRNMTKRTRIFSVLMLIAAALMARTSAQAAPSPNVLFILLDDVGRDWFRCYGSQEDQTRAIDRLARCQSMLLNS